MIESVVLFPEDGLYGVDIPKNIWHNVECQNANAVKVGVLIFLLTEVICTPVTTTLEYVTTSKKIDNQGNEKVTGYEVLEVYNYFENEAPIETPEGKRRRQKEEAEKSKMSLFTEEDYK